MKTLQTLGNLMIDNKDLADSYNWDEVKRQIELLNSRNYQGFNDWRLPDKDELNTLYINRDKIGGFSDAFYWSSSEYDANLAWVQYFYDDYQDCASKDYNYLLVRCVRPV